MIVSTPDRDSYSPADQPANPYRVMELTREEFVTLLNRRFRHVTMLWQRTLVGSALLPGPEASAMPETLCLERRGDAHFEMSTGYARPQYPRRRLFGRSRHRRRRRVYTSTQAK